MLILKNEIDDLVKGEAISEFLDVPQFELIRSNVGSEKEYAEVYRQFRQLISLPESYLHEMFTSRYATHFYDETEIEEFTREWTNNSRPQSMHQAAEI